MRRETWSGGVLVEVVDPDAGTVTTFGPNGSTRPMTDAEVAAHRPVPPTAAEQLRAEIASLPAPTMPADVLDVLDRALALLDGA